MVVHQWSNNSSPSRRASFDSSSKTLKMEAGFTYHASTSEFSHQSLSAAIAAVTDSSSTPPRRSRQSSPGRCVSRNQPSYSPPLPDENILPDVSLHRQLAIIADYIMRKFPVRVNHLLSLHPENETDGQLVERLQWDLRQNVENLQTTLQGSKLSQKYLSMDSKLVVFNCPNANTSIKPGPVPAGGFDPHAVYAGDNAMNTAAPQDFLATETVCSSLSSLLIKNGFTVAGSLIRQSIAHQSKGHHETGIQKSSAWESVMPNYENVQHPIPTLHSFSLRDKREDMFDEQNESSSMW